MKVALTFDSCLEGISERKTILLKKNSCTQKIELAHLG